MALRLTREASNISYRLAIGSGHSLRSDGAVGSCSALCPERAVASVPN